MKTIAEWDGIYSKTCWLRHRWGKWKQYHATMVGLGLVNKNKEWLEERQYRICDRCGLKQDKAVS